MNEPSLHELERDVEATRARLSRNLRTLRSPSARNEFTDAVKQEAFAAKDDFVERTRAAAQTRVLDWVDDVKARAAENPVAVLAIAAGIGWRLMNKPPIATALVGFGLYSLMRGAAPSRTGLSDQAYMDRAVENLRRRSSEVAADVAERAGMARQAAGETLSEWRGEAASRLRESGARAVDTAVATAAAASNQIDAAWQASEDAATRAIDGMGEAAADVQRKVEEGGARIARTAREWVGDGTTGRHSPLVAERDEAAAWAERRLRARSEAGSEFTGWAVDRPDEARRERAGSMLSDTVNQVLLGAAGVAVAAAVGVAVQRRLSETEPAD